MGTFTEERLKLDLAEIKAEIAYYETRLKVLEGSKVMLERVLLGYKGQDAERSHQNPVKPLIAETLTGAWKQINECLRILDEI